MIGSARDEQVFHGRRHLSAAEPPLRTTTDDRYNNNIMRVKTRPRGTYLDGRRRHCRRYLDDFSSFFFFCVKSTEYTFYSFFFFFFHLVRFYLFIPIGVTTTGITTDIRTLYYYYLYTILTDAY